MSDDYQLLAYPDQPTLRLQEFEGPLDLLLHLIRRAEVDIYDIPIAAITKQYVDFLDQQTANRINVAGEYFVLAATLMAIKSAMLLPKPPDPDPVTAEEAPADPREELVAQLLEYERYKQAAVKLKDREHHRRQEYTRPAMQAPANLVTRQFAPGVSLDQLTAAFVKVAQRHAGAQVAPQTIDPDPVTVADRIAAIQRLVTGPTRFEDLFEDEWTRDQLVTTFLALLDLAKHQLVSITQAVAFGPLIVTPGPRKAAEDDG